MSVSWELTLSRLRLRALLRSSVGGGAGWAGAGAKPPYREPRKACGVVGPVFWTAGLAWTFLGSFEVPRRTSVVWATPGPTKAKANTILTTKLRISPALLCCIYVTRLLSESDSRLKLKFPVT